MTQEALKLALEFIENSEGGTADLEAHIKEALAQTQEPVAWMVYTQEGQFAFVTDNPAQIHPSQRALPLYVAPQRTWVVLTDEEIMECLDQVYGFNMRPDSFARAIEAKLKELNT